MIDRGIGTSAFKPVLAIVLFLFIGCALLKENGCGKQKACAIPDCDDYSCVVYGLNENPFPISMSLEIKKFNNLVFNKADEETFVLGPGERKAIKRIDEHFLASGWSFSASINWTVGSYKEEPDFNWMYALPFQKSHKYLVTQGYNGSATHKDASKYAIDFNLAKGDTVCAARKGVVIEYVDSNDSGCSDSTCSKYQNYLWVLHGDGTIGVYNHLSKKGVLVSIGDTIQKSQKIGISGATGFATGPHLHFEVMKPKNSAEYESLPTIFDTKEGLKEELKEGVVYTAK